MFAASTYRQRREALKSRIGSGKILICGNEESSINFKDNWYHFRQDSTFLYYFGISLPGLAGIIDCDSGEEFVVGDELTMDHIIWTGPQPTIASLAEKVGVSHTLPTNKVQEKLKGAIVHFTPPYRAEKLLKLSAWLGKTTSQIEAEYSVALIEAIVAQRQYKSAEELVEIEKAVNVTGQMHLTAMRMARAGMKEAELVAELHKVAIGSGGKLSFPVIMTKNGQILHNHYYGNTLQAGDLVLCDAGAETDMGYAGDMTRTFPINPTFDSRQKDLYEVVLHAHEAAVAALKPGIRNLDVHLLASEKLVEGLIELGLMKGNAKDAVAAGAHTLFFQCGLGHMMGLDVHDMEDLGEQYVGYTSKMKKGTAFGLKSLRLGKQLEAGFVLTIEPGIYVIPELIDRWKADSHLQDFINYKTVETFKDFGGIRLEEDFLITPDGAQLLGQPIAKSVAEIEEIRQG